MIKTASNTVFELKKTNGAVVEPCPNYYSDSTSASPSTYVGTITTTGNSITTKDSSIYQYDTNWSANRSIDKANDIFKEFVKWAKENGKDLSKIFKEGQERFIEREGRPYAENFKILIQKQ